MGKEFSCAGMDPNITTASMKAVSSGELALTTVGATVSDLTVRIASVVVTVFKAFTIHDNRPFHIAEISGHLGKEMPDGESNPSMRGINVVGFNGCLGG